MISDNKYDVIIIGGSYAGLAASMALGRALRKVLIIDSGDPCNKQTPYSHNFLTNDGRSPAEIAGIAKQQVLMYDTVSFLHDLVTSASKTNDRFIIGVQSGKRFEAKKLVFATGVKDIMPNIPGFAESWGISVLHCPYCHGYEVRNQKTGILANGDGGYDFATLISNWTNDLTLYTNGKSNLTIEQATKLRSHKIRIVEDEIEELKNQNGYLQNIVFKSERRESIKALYAKISFAQHSNTPQSLGCELTQEGYIKIDSTQKTSVPGVFACGDNVTRMRTVANAISMGTTTGMMVNKELIEDEFQQNQKHIL
ncbi:MAG TPA: NAD(P)/FAD-dependent oxidoreductase [Cyclobacteriaceae bacterium]|jgi:thioredoxin reductase|nr:NAD(P)/FAD-dependent oxidoreductase [Cyclobacteriaceae bacterium]